MRYVEAVSIPERLRWVVETLDVQPADRVLEIGCGRGVAVSLICDRLDGGRITAIDRSEKMIDAARGRNAGNLASGKAVLETVALEDAAFEEDVFDKIFAVNVNLFWTRSPDKELRLLRRWLAPAGALYICYEPPAAGGVERVVEKVAPAVAAHDFSITTRTGITGKSAHLVCIEARPS